MTKQLYPAWLQRSKKFHRARTTARCSKLPTAFAPAARSVVTFGGRSKWTDHLDLCATLFYGLIKDHPFHDCNKRTALLIALYYLQLIRRTPDTSQRDFENLAVKVAQNKFSDYPRYKDFSKVDDGEILFLSNFFRRNTRVINKRHYIITYNQLNHILSKYGYKLTNPAGNYIDVVKEEVSYSGIFSKKKQIIHRRVTQIGFPGWKTEVTRKALRRVRQATGLTNEKGYDADVLLHGMDPMEALISTYKGPLERLADR